MFMPILFSASRAFTAFFKKKKKQINGLCVFYRVIYFLKWMEIVLFVKILNSKSNGPHQKKNGI
jgi:hypothetical protein